VPRYVIMDHVVIVGGGFGGLSAAQSLKNVPVRLTLLDRRNFHLFQPLLYQVATGWLSPANIASTLRATLRHQRNASVLLAEAKDFDVEKRRVLLDDGEIQYDTLVLATGSGTHYFGNDRWAVYAPGLKTVEDATEIRRRVLKAFEGADHMFHLLKSAGRSDEELLSEMARTVAEWAGSYAQ